MALSSTRLKDNIVADLFPNLSSLSPAEQAQVQDAWVKICTRIIEEITMNAETVNKITDVVDLNKGIL